MLAAEALVPDPTFRLKALRCPGEMSMPQSATARLQEVGGEARQTPILLTTVRVIEADKVNVHPVCNVLLVATQSHSLRSKPSER